MSTLTIKDQHTNETGALNNEETLRPAVLVVDDQPICRTIIAKLIKAQGATVDTAQDGVEALSIWKVKKQPIIITDCHMPKMDGYRLAKAIRRIEQSENMTKSTIVALTSNAQEAEVQLCTQAGMDKFLTKPINSGQIEMMLSQWEKLSSMVQYNATMPSDNKSNSNQPPIDYSILAQIFPDKTKLNAILNSLQENVHGDYLALQEQAKKTNLSEIENIAHRMKGSCKMAGANTIANVCEEIEEKAKNGAKITDLPLSALTESIREFDAYLKQRTHQTERGINTSSRAD